MPPPLSLFTWGSNQYAQLGHGTPRAGVAAVLEPRAVPELAAEDGYALEDVFCGAAVTGVKTSDGQVLTVGETEGEEDELGNGLFQPLETGESSVKQVAFGAQHRILLSASGQVFTWGLGHHGRLGNGSWDDSYVPHKVLGPLRRLIVEAVAAGSGHSVAMADGDVYTWGSGHCGQLGHHNLCDQVLPKRVEAFDDSRVVTQVACGADFTACLTADGRVYTFGFGAGGQLGHGNERDQWQPRVVVELEGKHVVRIACGYYHMLALTDAGDVYAWGSGTSGKLGLGDCRTSRVPELVKDLHGKAVVDVACGWNHCACITAAGQVFTWGYGRFGRLGHGDEGSHARPRPVAGDLGGHRAVKLACGAAHTAVLCTF